MAGCLRHLHRSSAAVALAIAVVSATTSAAGPFRAGPFPEHAQQSMGGSKDNPTLIIHAFVADALLLRMEDIGDGVAMHSDVALALAEAT